jgi:hypothetical protein
MPTAATHLARAKAYIGRGEDYYRRAAEEIIAARAADPTLRPRQLTMSAGTVHMGVIWDEDAWPLVKAGKINGYSLGGRAVRAAAGDPAMQHMGDKVIVKRYSAVATRMRDRLAASLGPLLDRANAEPPVQKAGVAQSVNTPSDNPHPRNTQPHPSSGQLRHPTGQFRTTVFRRADPHPTGAGLRFFDGLRRST